MSFSDLLSSAKGPGLIGLLLGFTVLGGFLILGTLTLDEQFQGGGRSISSVIRQHEETIENQKTQLKMLEESYAAVGDRERVAKALSAEKAKIRTEETAIAENGVRIAQIEKEIIDLELAFVDHKARYRTRVRDAAKGTSFPSLKTLDGKTYQQAIVREVNPVGMLISHRDGSKRIPYEQLPLEMQDFYQFDPDEMKAKEAAEALVRKRHLQATADALKAGQEQSDQNREEKERAAIVRRDQAISALSARISTLGENMQRLEYSIEAETRKKLSRAPQMRDQLTLMKREKAELEAKLQNLRTER